MIVRGTVIHCSRFGAVVRLDDGRLALYPSDGPGIATVRRAWSGGRRPQFPFDVDDERARRVRLSLARVDGATSGSAGHAGDDAGDVVGRAKLGSAASLEQKIIDYLRESAERDPRGAHAAIVRGAERLRADRLLPFESRARRQYRDAQERPGRRKR